MHETKSLEFKTTLKVFNGDAVDALVNRTEKPIAVAAEYADY